MDTNITNQPEPSKPSMSYMIIIGMALIILVAGFFLLSSKSPTISMPSQFKEPENSPDDNAMTATTPYRRSDQQQRATSSSSNGATEKSLYWRSAVRISAKQADGRSFMSSTI